MRRASLLFVVAACAGVPDAQKPVVASDAPPGTRWMTQLLPWHVSNGAGGVVVVDNVAIVAGTTGGTLEEIDLVSGARVRVHTLDKPLSANTFARLSDGRYLIAGQVNDVAHAAILDPTTFAATWFPLEPTPKAKDAKEVYAPGSAVELADHSIAIAGRDLPLAVYDAKTLARTRVLSDALSWSDLAATRTTLYARNKVTSTQSRFDVATAAATPQPGTTLMAAGGDIAVERAYEQGRAAFRIVAPDPHAAGKTITRPLPATLGYYAAVDADGTRVASLRGTAVTVYSTADGAVIGRFDIAPQRPWSAEFAFAGDKLLIATHNTLRVADLATGAITALAEPYAPYMQMAVDNAGTITAIGAEAWRFSDAALVSTASIGRATVLVHGSGRDRFAIRTERPFEPGLEQSKKFPSVITVKTLEGRTIREWTLPRETNNAWLGDNGQVVASYKWATDAPQLLVRSDGNAMRDIVAFHLDAMIDDVDVDGGFATLSLGGTATLVDLATGKKTSAVSNPHCAEYGIAELERGGTRVMAYDGADAILYDRATGKAIGSAHFPTDILSIAFIPGERELLFRVDDTLGLWDPATNTTRSLTYRYVYDVAISPDRQLATFAMRDGRLALVDFRALRAAMTAGATFPKAAIPASCSTRDPFDLRDPDEPGDDDQTGGDLLDHSDDDFDLDDGDTGD